MNRNGSGQKKLVEFQWPHHNGLGMVIRAYADDGMETIISQIDGINKVDTTSFGFYNLWIDQRFDIEVIKANIIEALMEEHARKRANETCKLFIDAFKNNKGYRNTMIHFRAENMYVAENHAKKEENPFFVVHYKKGCVPILSGVDGVERVYSHTLSFDDNAIYRVYFKETKDVEFVRDQIYNALYEDHMYSLIEPEITKEYVRLFKENGEEFAVAF